MPHDATNIKKTKSTSRIPQSLSVFVVICHLCAFRSRSFRRPFAMQGFLLRGRPFRTFYIVSDLQIRTAPYHSHVYMHIHVAFMHMYIYTYIYIYSFYVRFCCLRPALEASGPTDLPARALHCTELRQHLLTRSASRAPIRLPRRRLV